MRSRAFAPAVHGFLDTIREGHPRTPLLLISPIHCPIHEDTPGPTAVDPASAAAGAATFTASGSPDDIGAGRMSLRVVRELLRGVADARRDDEHLHYLDGQVLYGPGDAQQIPLDDALHPSTEAHRLIGTRFVRALSATEPLSP